MSRLTYKDTKVSSGYNAVDTDEYACVVKLGKLEDLEEKIGCPLEVIFKLLNQDYYYDELGHIWHLEFINLKNGATQFGAKGNVPQDLNNYKKTWWLRKDKSE